ncbi:MAG: radical SAM protein [Deltaproteobacteria bacterium CG11_big_fil_rev_8_21_14_0_20_49_13]|nr:MAG: radical SAM protein [Deltaproteobacteria bacterium CG11_big_fil_rev_8_21_14_0_20_49_13]
MSAKAKQFDQIWIGKEALLYPSTHMICERLPNVPFDIVDDVHILKHPSDINLSKRQLVLTVNKGASFKPCQGMSEGVVCCGYHTIDLASGCNCDCSYCILQHYLANNPMTAIYVNIEEILGNVKKHLESHKDIHFRIGTGELSDSLAYDHITGYSKTVVRFFATQSNATFEFKTKTVNIDNLLSIKHGGRTVVSWSVNPQGIIDSEEKNSASLKERVEAAKACVGAGYRVGFHFDPMINYPGWENDYKEVIDEIFSYVQPMSVAWISLGSLRFPHTLKAIAEKRFPLSRIFCGEFIPANGKMRYFRPIREEMYKKMRSWITEKAPLVVPYLCMETKTVCDRYDSY